MKISGWTQNSDYSTQDLGAVAFERASAVVPSFPWAEQLGDYAERLLREEDACPPGVGFNTDASVEVFHLFATASDEWTLRLVLRAPGKILGLFRKPAHESCTTIESLDKGIALLALFYAGDREQLIAEARKRPSSDWNLPLTS